MKDGTFRKVEKSGKRMYGPPGIVVCGYPAPEHEPLADALRQIGLGDRPIIFVSGKDAGKTMAEILASYDRYGLGEDSQLPRAIIMSGFTQEELHTLMSAYRGSGLPKQLWATLTPVSETWNLEDLLKELAAEAAAFRNRGE